MRSTGFVTQPDARNVLDLPQDDMFAALQTTGAMNLAPRLARSSHLKNKNTGLIMPWNELAAEQRDIMVNCDKYGNTDPAAWEPTVVEDDYTEDEKEAQYWEARNTVVKQALHMTGQHYADPKETSIPVASRVPNDTMSLDEYYDQLEKLNKELDF